MTHPLLYSYLIGWVITSIGVALLTRRHRSQSAALGLAAGAVWPLVILGAAQFAAIAVVAEITRRRQRSSKSLDHELMELLANADSGDRVGV